MRRDAALAAAVLLLATVYGGAFVGDATRDPNPVSFGTTASSGLTAETVHRTQATGGVVPKAQVSYAQFETVVGYYGIGSLVAALDREGHAQRFGPPLGVFVSDFAGTDPTVSDAGYPVPAAGRPGWIPAADARYVVVPDRSGPTGHTSGAVVVPFGDAAAAERFADRVGPDATVRTWATVRERLDGPTRTRSWPATVDARAETANRTAVTARGLVDRPVSLVVGEDAPTVQRAVDAAPPNTTVYVPPGTYRERVRIDRPLTLRGAGAATVLSASSNGTGVTVTSDRVAVTDLTVRDVGTDTIEIGNASDAWDTHVRQTYGRGDAGVAFANTTGALVADVTVRTPSNGVLLRRTDETLVENVTVRGTAADGGYMGVMAMEATAAVVQASTFSGTLDGVYAHRSNGLVVRDSRMRDVRFGTHLMFTSDTLLAGNVARDTDTGLVVMTRPAGNALVDNHVRDSDQGIVTAGSDSYVARNRLVDNDVGLEIGTRRSLYEHNALVGNGVGADAAVIVASNRVVGNDFVRNDRPATAPDGSTRVWSNATDGNYWARAAGGPVDAVDRSYRPTSAVDARYGAPGTRLVSESPALVALRQLRGTVPGMRSGGIVDQHPAAAPVNPELLAAARNDSRRATNDPPMNTNVDR